MYELEAKFWWIRKVSPFLGFLRLNDRRVCECGQGGSVLRDIVQVQDILGFGGKGGVLVYEGFCAVHRGVD